MRKDVHMAPFRSIFLLFTCLCLLFTTACTAKPISDESALCAGAICDDASFLYCVRNREVWKIDKATYAVSATGLPCAYAMPTAHCIVCMRKRCTEMMKR